jgi:gas vesicle protein
MNLTATLPSTLTETIDDVESTVIDAYETTTRRLSERADEITHEITSRLDEVEERIPELPKKIFAYNRAVAHRVANQARRNNELVVDAFRPVVRVADTGVRTVVGTTRWAVEQTTDTARTGVRSVVGQAKAQAKRTAQTLSDQTTDLVEEATDRVVEAERRAERTALSSMTKAELYQMAQDIDIDGRADMTKAQLIEAINDAG